MPYTIVLTPPAPQAMKLISASQSLYSDNQPSYLLAEDGSSSPHVTVVQFDCDTPELAHKVWEALCNKMHQEQFELFEPLFTGLSFIEGTGPYKGTTWVELSIQRGDENSPLMRLHYAALQTLKYFHLNPLNATGSNYRPHLTLARIVMPKQIKAWPKDLYMSVGNFNLEFGLSDDKWQYAQRVEIFQEPKEMQSSFVISHL